ncbi:MAG: Uma2 family endonuclease [Nitrospirota bacterium]
MSTPDLQTRRWTRAEYERIVEAGVLQPEERVELLDGEILTMTPQNSPHAATVGLVERVLQRVFGPDHWVRVQLPLIVDPDSEPEPDLAVVSGTPRDYVAEHPRTALLVVEVADTTLEKDRDRKAAIYARAGVPEYWIVNFVDRCLEVYQDPVFPPNQPARYQTSRRLMATDRIAPLARPDASVSVADLLP